MTRKIRSIALGVVALMGVIGILSSQLSWSSSDESAASHSQPAGVVPVQGMVTLVDLGASSCIPCRMMAPIIEKIEKEYRGKAAIIFIDVWKDKESVKRFGIRAFPTQIFFDKDGERSIAMLASWLKQTSFRGLKKMDVH